MKNDLIDEYHRLRKEADDLFYNNTERLKTDFKNSFNWFFEKHPRVKMVTWTQYTPYFNDGDECVFSVNEAVFSGDENYRGGIYNLEDEPMVEGYIKEPSKWHREYYTKKDPNHKFEFDALPEEQQEANRLLDKDFEALKSMIQYPEDFMKGMFGDHAQVIVTRKGIEVEEYSHD